MEQLIEGKESLMSDKMIPVPFPQMLEKLITEYKNFGTLMGVTVCPEELSIPVGPAAGPHTQLAGNIVAAYASGANCFELKTVQILEGEDLHIVKPCIYAGNKVFNTEWSTELTIEGARDEYIKAYLLIQILSMELQLRDADRLSYIMSVGYDLKGIQSPKVDTFINDLIHASATKEWQKDISYVKEHLSGFQNITICDINKIEERDTVSDTVTLSTMHGCRSSEIEGIAVYLLQQKRLNTYIKMNPTLIGKEAIRNILDQKGYHEIVFDDKIFEKDITLSMAEDIIRKCQTVADEVSREFGVKLTNTFPVINTKQELRGDEMYLSGPVLYPMAIGAAATLAHRLDGKLRISYSGGADQYNIREILAAGIAPVTISSLLLKPGGYQHLTRLMKEAKDVIKRDTLDLVKLTQIAGQALADPHYQEKKEPVFQYSKNYDNLCAKCHNCVDVCPNRANIRLEMEKQSYVIHRERLCNECGCCTCACILGHNPYREKFTLFEEETEYNNSVSDGILLINHTFKYREKGQEKPVPEPLLRLMQIAIEKGKI